MDCLTSLPEAHPEVRNAIRNFMGQCGRPITYKYPFGNPVSIEETHIPILEACEYLLADKSDGVRVCVILCQNDDASAFYCGLLDRKGKVYGLSVKADAVFYQGTAMDAELVKRKDGSYSILAFDTCVIAGNKEVEYMSLPNRLELCKVTTDSTVIVTNNITLETKPMFSLGNDSELAAFAAHITALQYETDGYILTPMREGTCQPGIAPLVFKIKDAHTIDFVWSGHMLWYGDLKDMYPITNLGVNFNENELIEIPSGSVVEMAPEREKTGNVAMFHLLQVRHDKDTANNFFTVSRTMQSIKDAITLDRVLKIVRVR